jgi:hypothetical protein
MGSPGASSPVARGGRATYVARRQGVAVATTWAPAGARSCARETQSKAGNGCGSGLWGLPTPFIGWRRERRQCRGGETTCDEWSFSMLLFQGEEKKQATPVSKGERRTQGDSWYLCEGATGGCSGAATTHNRSRAASGLTWGGAQLVVPVGLKGCLDQIPLWR